MVRWFTLGHEKECCTYVHTVSCGAWAWAARGCWLEQDGRTMRCIIRCIILDAMQVCAGGLKLAMYITTYLGERDFTVNVFRQGI